MYCDYLDGDDQSKIKYLLIISYCIIKLFEYPIFQINYIIDKNVKFQCLYIYIIILKYHTQL